MLEVQRYLSSGKTLADLENEFGIKAKHHDSLPLVILNYDQISSPKTATITRECRALTLCTANWNVVAKSMHRFFNWGEVVEEMKLFDFSDFTVQEKCDGSLVLLYVYHGDWRVNTRGSFATDKLDFQDFTWEQGICQALGVPSLKSLDPLLDPYFNLTLVCEFCSPWNKVVRRYDKPVMYLLTAFCGEAELDPAACDLIAQKTAPLFLRPPTYQFTSIEEIQAFLQQQAEQDPTFEGVVIRDRNNLRFKAKSATYLGLHRLRGEGDNMFHPKHLLPFILAGEEDELLTYFGEVKEQFYRLKAEVLKQYIDLLETWVEHKDIEDQKQFALAVKDRPFSSVLFSTRKKYGKLQRAADLRNEWRAADQQILKYLKA